jgi:hypothetical protein
MAVHQLQDRLEEALGDNSPIEPGLGDCCFTCSR